MGRGLDGNKVLHPKGSIRQNQRVHLNNKNNPDFTGPLERLLQGWTEDNG
jgi:hypothetical protein